MGEGKVIGAITVGRGKKRRELKITEHPFYISKEENDARVKRLAAKIWDCIVQMDFERGRKKPSVDELLNQKDLLRRD